MKIGLVGETYQEESLPFDAQRSINCYPVVDQKGGKEIAAMYGTPGLRLFTSLGAGACRAEFLSSITGRYFVVSGAILYEVDGNGNSVNRGSLQFSSGNVMMNENTFQLAICDGINFYIFVYATNTFQRVINPNIPSVGTFDFLDGYFIASKNNSGQFNICAPNDGLVWNALDFANAESSPDNLLCVKSALGQLWLFGLFTTEIWTNTGSTGFPFERISGAKMETGIVAPHTAIAVDNSIVWVGRDKNGSCVVYRARGFQPQRISTSPIERVLQEASHPENMRSYVYQSKGRTFYMLTGGGLPTTFCYEFSTQMWHERAYLNQHGDFEQHLGSCGVFAFNQHLVGDRRNGNIYVMSDDIYDDNGEPLAFERTYTHIIDEMQRVRYNKLIIGVETGVGTQTGQGQNPLISLQLSKDGARTWSNWFTKAIGRVGKYLTNVTFRRLGMAQQMTFKIRITDPVPRRISGSYLS